ncbi:MAG: hypothetical protein IT365_22185 [Candidatus Hydrogenedentes bacterium]|nr:hypothetical protein [Candidatus Hydrogenedentota bacterium]
MRLPASMWVSLGLIGISCTETTSLNIHYDYAGLTQITIADNTLTYVTHSLKTDLLAVAQDMSSYDRHEAITPLTDEDRQSLLTWVQAHDWKRLAKGYPSGDPGSYGAAFQYVLDIRLGRTRHQASWDGTSDCPDIVKAVNELQTICSQIIERKRATDTEPEREHLPTSTATPNAPAEVGR